ncbi:MAG: DUF4337 domain-containing protein [Proteobacteria bacterium]|nr:DUF4337 domain-containing protein [Pseudomonadota bacterium]
MERVELPNTKELEELKARRFTKRIALTTAVYAVLLAITALGGNKAMKEMLLGQQEASNQWAFYQAKAMRENLYKIQRLNMEANFLERSGSMKPEARSQFKATINRMAVEENRYALEKKDIEHEAKKAEHERDINKKRDPYFEFAEGLLQISIVMASIAILSSFLPIFYFSLVIAMLGAFLSFNGFTLLFCLPFF